MLVTVVLAPLDAQYNIDIKVNNYDNDTLIVGYLFAEKQLVKDTLIKTNKGKFKFTGQDTLKNGVYILLTSPDQQYIQFHINDGENKFSIEYDYEDKSKLKFKGSKSNSAFQKYLDLVMQERPKAVILRDTIKALKGLEDQPKAKIDKFEKELDVMDKLILKSQNQLIKADPNSVAALILKGSKEIEVPSFEGEDNPEKKKFDYYKAHFFDNIDLGHPTSMNIGLINPKIETYLSKLTSNHPDSIMTSLDYLLKGMAPASDTYRYYLSNFLNSYARSRIVGYDALYVHLADNYYSKEKSPWVNDETLTKIKKKSDGIRPSLIGKIGGDLTVYAEDGKTPITLSEIDYEYLILIFWAPDCGHCTKMMPKFVEINDRWKETPVKTFAICTKHQDKTASCWEKLEDKNMLGFINGADKYHRSKFKVKYNVVATPRVYILDKDRKILMKGIGANQLEEVLIEVLNAEKRQDIIPKAAKEAIAADKKAAAEKEKNKSKSTPKTKH